MQSAKEVVSLSVTPSGYSMFQELATQLNQLYNTLALPLFNQAWKNLALQLDQVRQNLKRLINIVYSNNRESIMSLTVSLRRSYFG